jgi:hypothetical protein
MQFDPDVLKAEALKVVGKFQSSKDCSAGGVGAAVLSASGELFTGICIDTACSVGFCAEHAAIAEMLKHRQTRIVAVIAVNAKASSFLHADVAGNCFIKWTMRTGTRRSFSPTPSSLCANYFRSAEARRRNRLLSFPN